MSVCTNNRLFAKIEKTSNEDVQIKAEIKRGIEFFWSTDGCKSYSYLKESAAVNLGVPLCTWDISVCFHYKCAQTIVNIK